MGIKVIYRTDTFIKWLKKLKDRTGKFLVTARISRLREGNPGDSVPIGGGLSEMRIHYGPGYRVYYEDTGKEIIILLCGGNKSTQEADIARARAMTGMPVTPDAEDQDGTSNR
jgi:putative addiction module killer protein